jgi:hypothetical protein
MRSTAFARLALAAAAAAFGCSPPTSPLELAGVYTLQTANGAGLPYALPVADAMLVEVLSDAFTLHPSGTYGEIGEKRYTSAGFAGVAFVTDAGTFTRRGDAIVFESLLLGRRPATIRNGVLTLVDHDVTLVYQK